MAHQYLLLLILSHHLHSSGNMTLRESQEGLLELQEIHDGPKPPSYPGNESMPLDVMFKIWHTRNYSNIPQRPIRLIFDANASVAEAGRFAFRKYIGDVPDDIYVDLSKNSWQDAFIEIGDENEKIKNVFQESETLVVSDIPNYQKTLLKSFARLVVGVACGCTLLSIFITLIVAYATK